MKIAIALLAILLIVSNVFWFYQAFDSGITLSYRNQQTYELEETRKQLMSVLPEIANNVSKEEIILAAVKHTDMELFEKEGCTWIGWLGFKFDENDKLMAVSPRWSYGEKDPCYLTF